MLTYGFYNSINHDRIYDATQLSTIFNGIINDGIFMSIGSQMMVTANGGMNICVGAGRAWFNGTWTNNDTALPLEVGQSELILDRIDAVVLEIDSSTSVRENSIKIVKGTPSSNPEYPTLVDTEEVHQHVLAYIKVDAEIEEITQSKITNMVGSTNTPFVTGILQTIDASALTSQWIAEWSEWMASCSNDYEAWQTEHTELFGTWFDHIKSQLSTDAAGNLQLEIDEISEDIAAVKEDTVTIKEMTLEKYKENEENYAKTNVLYAITDL